jgi:hypothetical protein
VPGFYFNIFEVEIKAVLLTKLAKYF